MSLSKPPIVINKQKTEKVRVKKPLYISVSKKTFKTAVQRNKAKRLIRESFRLFKKDFPETVFPALQVHANITVLDTTVEELKRIIKNNI